MDNLKTVSPSPHFHGNLSTRTIMLDVIIALIPSVIASVILFGFYSLLLIAVSVITAVVSEYLFNLASKKKQTITDLSAVVSGLILALILPSSTEIWQIALGSAIAIVIIKCFFGGIGQNFANPAATSRIILLLSFTPAVASGVFPIVSDTVSSATPLALLSNGNDTSSLPSLLDMFLGIRGGAIGEGCILAILLGGTYLLIRKVISWHAPVAYIGTVFILSLIWESGDIVRALVWTMGGGVVFAAFFMITDYATTPKTFAGKLVFGFGCGLITFAIRAWGSYPEGASYAILFMNIITPYIEKWTQRKPFGGAKA